MDYMLSKLPEFIEVDKNVVESFKRLGPLTLEMFVKVAEEHNLPAPRIDDGLTTIKRRTN